MIQNVKKPNNKKMILPIILVVVVACLFLPGCTGTSADPGQPSGEPKAGAFSGAAPVSLTANLDPNPHLPSHLGEPDCASCHGVKSKEDISCLECHFMDWPTDKLVQP